MESGICWFEAFSFPDFAWLHPGFSKAAPNVNYRRFVLTNAITMNLRFPGQYYDQESGLHHNYFRDYDPEVGRYIERDPIGLKRGLNEYGYVKNNPVMKIDPNGLRVRAVDWEKQDYSVCSYYDRVAKEAGCLYHGFAAIACRDQDFAVNAMVDSCYLTSTRQLNCIRRCLVREDEKARDNPVCQIRKDKICNDSKCSEKPCICTKRSCVNDYHDKCYLECHVSTACYGGHYWQGFPTDGN